MFFAFFEAGGQEEDLRPGGPDCRVGVSLDSNLYTWRDRGKGTAAPLDRNLPVWPGLAAAGVDNESWLSSPAIKDTGTSRSSRIG